MNLPTSDSSNPEASSPNYLLDIALEGHSDAAKNRVIEIALKAGVEPNDPVFLILLAAGQLSTALSEAPQDINAMLTD